VIGWCTECKTVAIEPIEDGYDVRCFSCSWREGLLGPYHSTEYFAPREYNTVDLAELRRDRKLLFEYHRQRWEQLGY
jgi:hypothetical protein